MKARKDFLKQYGSSKEVAKVVGCHFRTIENWAKQGIIGQSEAGYDLIDACQRQIEQLRTDLDKARLAKSSDKDELYLANVRLKNAEADLKELDVAERKGVLVEAAVVEKEWADLVIAAKAKLLSLPTKLAYILAGESEPTKVEIKLSEAIRSALEELGGSAES